MTYRGHIQNGVVVLDEPVTLPEGSTVFVESESMRNEALEVQAAFLASLFPPEDLEDIEQAVIGCRKVDPDGW
jgi:hypothetical protein